MVSLKRNFLVMVLCFWAVNLYSQTNPVNTSCSAAEMLCQDRYEQTYDYTNPFYANCIDNVTRLYYYFNTQGGAGTDLGNFITSALSGYKLYGPFDEPSVACEQLNGLPTTPVLESTSNANTHNLSFAFTGNKVYLLEVKMSGCSGNIQFKIGRDVVSCDPITHCADCIQGFNPSPGKYVISAWAKQENASVDATRYTAPVILLSCPSVSSPVSTYSPSGQIIDGWQQIDGVFTVPVGATDFRMELKAISGSVLFDDIRIYPVDGSMLSYVYDPVTLRLAAELDERNYAKLYEYDEEGKLTRVKKETEKGIMTIQENRENSKKSAP